MDRKGTILALAIGALFAASACGVDATGQTTGSKNPPLVISSMYGRDLFEFYCASCHGRDGRGSGPAASALKTPPPDLTAIAKREGGRFPRGYVESFVTGESDRVIPAHGSREMPVWGPILRGLDPQDAVNKMRIANIVGYIETIQQK